MGKAKGVAPKGWRKDGVPQMDVLRAWLNDRVPPVWRDRALFLLSKTQTFDPKALFGLLAGEARLRGIFAVSEICKGLAVYAIGDMVIADGLGEFVTATAQSLRLLADARYSALP
jgi:hypothetical protein